jgi:hypothetical protein
VAAHLPSFKVDQHLQQGEAAAWQLQAHAAALQIVLTEVHLNAQPAEAVSARHCWLRGYMQLERQWVEDCVQHVDRLRRCEAIWVTPG